MRRSRRTLPTHLNAPFAAFEAQAERVEAARSALLSCLPRGRGTSRAPVAVGLELIGDELTAIAPELERWRVPEIEPHWQDCRVAVERARARIGKAIAVVARTDEVHDLVAQVAAIVQPLEAWADAEEGWHALRRRERPE